MNAFDGDDGSYDMHNQLQFSIMNEINNGL